jgi:hypothetical protein
MVGNIGTTVPLKLVGKKRVARTTIHRLRKNEPVHIIAKQTCSDRSLLLFLSRYMTTDWDSLSSFPGDHS